MRKKSLLFAILLLIAGLLPEFSAPFAARTGKEKSGASGSFPKLVVLIVVDSMRADYPDRFSSFFGERGLRRLAREGRVFTHARLSHAITITGPGHSVIGSGIYGDRSGIVGNRWYSYEEGEDVNCARGPVREGVSGECAPG